MGVCHAIKPRVKELAEEYKISVEEIDATLHPEVASLYEVLTVPAVTLTLGDKELHRQARFIDLLEPPRNESFRQRRIGNLKNQIF